MPTRPQRRTGGAGEKDAIRIVPLYLPEALTVHNVGVAKGRATAKPKLTYRGGPLLTAVRVFTVFWGSAWKKAPQTKMVTDLNAFSTAILPGPLLTTQMAEYSVPKHKIGGGSFIGAATVATPPLVKSVTDAAIQATRTIMTPMTTIRTRNPTQTKRRLGQSPSLLR